MHAKPLPVKVAHLLQSREAVLRASSTVDTGAGVGEVATTSLAVFRRELAAALEEAGEEWKGAVDRVLSFGPKRVGPNLLLSGEGSPAGAGDASPADYARRLPSWWHVAEHGVDGDAVVVPLRSALVQGFQLATGAGPLCAEPMWGVAFVLDEVRLLSAASTSALTPATDMAASTPAPAAGESAAPGALDTAAAAVTPHAPQSTSAGHFTSSGQVIAAAKEAAKTAFLAGSVRLVEAMYR
jgi:translation elongation factor EF-G